ncbi:MAG: DUF541 domain-containing protein [Candidatus Aminicenantes bacterium]|nr:DUF541 domain-containing protein [Candidatus Aminicenantes bacterium]
MLKIFTCLFGVLALALPHLAAPIEDEETTIIVAGKGVVKINPDVAYLWMGAEKTENNAEEAQKVVTQKINDILASLDKMKIPKDKIETTRVVLQTEYKYDKGKRTLVGYTARNQIKVTVDKLDNLGKIIDISIASGATNITNIMFSVKEEAPHKKSALKKAFDDAKAKAEIIAKASDLILTRIQRIQEVETQIIAPVRGMPTFQAQARVGETEAPVLPGKLEVHGNLTVIFECKRKF